MPCANPNGSFSSFIASEVLVRYASSTRIAGICVRRRTDVYKRQALAVLRERNIPFLLLGNGSNMLVADAGIRGAVVCLSLIHIYSPLF